MKCQCIWCHVQVLVLVTPEVLHGRPERPVACYGGSEWNTISCRHVVSVARVVTRSPNPSQRSCTTSLIHVSAAPIMVEGRRRRAHGTQSCSVHCSHQTEFRVPDIAIWGVLFSNFYVTSYLSDYIKDFVHHASLNFFIRFLLIPPFDQAQFGSKVDLMPLSV
jgi:hypothetical protein